MKTYKINENQIMNIVEDVVNKYLNETENYEGNDLDYEIMYEEAIFAILRLRRRNSNSKIGFGWRDVAREMNIRLETLNDADMELLKDAIEDAWFEMDKESNADVDEYKKGFADGYIDGKRDYKSGKEKYIPEPKDEYSRGYFDGYLKGSKTEDDGLRESRLR